MRFVVFIVVEWRVSTKLVTDDFTTVGSSFYTFLISCVCSPLRKRPCIIIQKNLSTNNVKGSRYFQQNSSRWHFGETSLTFNNFYLTSNKLSMIRIWLMVMTQRMALWLHHGTNMICTLWKKSKPNCFSLNRKHP